MLWFSGNVQVDDVIKDLGLSHVRDQRIGNEDNRGLSGGEKKRVSIATELVTLPRILFLDEPTSGLDSYNAYSIMNKLRALAHDNGQTIVCTIHQPRQMIYQLFDKVILLWNGMSL